MAEKKFTTVSSVEIKDLYTPKDIQSFNYDEKLGMPGKYPYTRGIYESMYRGQTWTKRQFAGFGSAKDTNKRYHYLLSQGQTGLSVAFDFPTLMGYDSDSQISKGEVGKCGVAIDSLADMETLFEGDVCDADLLKLVSKKYSGKDEGRIAKNKLKTQGLK